MRADVPRAPRQCTRPSPTRACRRRRHWRHPRPQSPPPRPSVRYGNRPRARVPLGDHVDVHCTARSAAFKTLNALSFCGVSVCAPTGRRWRVMLNVSAVQSFTQRCRVCLSLSLSLSFSLSFSQLSLSLSLSLFLLLSALRFLCTRRAPLLSASPRSFDWLGSGRRAGSVDRRTQRVGGATAVRCASKRVKARQSAPIEPPRKALPGGTCQAGTAGKRPRGHGAPEPAQIRNILNVALCHPRGGIRPAPGVHTLKSSTQVRGIGSTSLWSWAVALGARKNSSVVQSASSQGRSRSRSVTASRDCPGWAVGGRPQSRGAAAVRGIGSSR